jgi:hypothetical protein
LREVYFCAFLYYYGFLGRFFHNFVFDVNGLRGVVQRILFVGYCVSDAGEGEGLPYRISTLPSILVSRECECVPLVPSCYIGLGLHVGISLHVYQLDAIASGCYCEFHLALNRMIVELIERIISTNSKF